MAVLTISLVAVIVILPRVVDRPPAGASVAIDSRPRTPTPAPSIPTIPAPTASEPAENGLRRTVDGALREGGSALSDRDPDSANIAFRRAAALDPDNTEAEDGLRQAETLAAVIALETEAAGHESRGEIDAATTSARRALALDPSSTAARGVVDRAARELQENSYQDLISRGLAALENRQYRAALDVFSAAGERRPSAPEVADGLARARAGLHRESVAAHLARAVEAEETERWQGAVDEYRAALGLEPNLATARSGLTRCDRRLKLSERVIFHLEHPGRLATAEVLEEAVELADEAKSVTPRGPRHQELVARLDALIVLASTPVTVVLESDGLTEVVLHRFGQLGSFERHTVDLRPGTYTVVGRRAGYRDVRLTVRVDPHRPPETVVVRCTERI